MLVSRRDSTSEASQTPEIRPICPTVRRPFCDSRVTIMEGDLPCRLVIWQYSCHPKCRKVTAYGYVRVDVSHTSVCCHTIYDNFANIWMVYFCFCDDLRQVIIFSFYILLSISCDKCTITIFDYFAWLPNEKVIYDF